MPTTSGLPRPTLKNMQRQAPPQDRGGAALASNRPRYDTQFARTLDELRERCGDAGEWAALDARYIAITVWFMRAMPKLANPYEVASVSHSLCREEARYASGLPCPEGIYPALPIIRRISPESRDEARQVTADTVRQWEAAGMPCLTPDLITRTHQYILACQRAKQSEIAA